MTFKVNHGAQWPLVSVQVVKFDELVLVDGKMLLTNLPQNAVFLKGGVNFVTANDDTNTNIVTYAIGTDSDPDKFVAALAADTAASYVPFTLGLGYVNSAGENIYITPSAAFDDDATAGEYQLIVEYIILGRSNETQTH